MTDHLPRDHELPGPDYEAIKCRARIERRRAMRRLVRTVFGLTGR